MYAICMLLAMPSRPRWITGWSKAKVAELFGVHRHYPNRLMKTVNKTGSLAKQLTTKRQGRPAVMTTTKKKLIEEFARSRRHDVTYDEATRELNESLASHFGVSASTF